MCFKMGTINRWPLLEVLCPLLWKQARQLEIRLLTTEGAAVQTIGDWDTLAGHPSGSDNENQIVIEITMLYS